MCQQMHENKVQYLNQQRATLTRIENSSLQEVLEFEQVVQSIVVQKRST